MSLVSMLRGWLFTRGGEAEASEARFLAHRISDHADAITSGAQKYIRARDPFAALMADMYNREQVNRIYRGNEHSKPS